MATATGMATETPPDRRRLRSGPGWPVAAWTFFPAILNATFASAQLPGATPQGPSNAPAAIAATPAIGGDGAAEAAPRRAWFFAPRLSVSQTFTDNVGLDASGANRSDQITEISPGLRLQGESARMRMFVDYSMRNFAYAQDSTRNRISNTLNSFGTLEAIDKWLFVDLSAVIAQQTISALGTQSTSATSVNSNSTDTTSVRLSPYVRGRFGALADYEMRYTHSDTRSSSNLAANIASDDVSARLRGATAFANLGWSLEGSRQSIEYGGGRRSEADRARLFLSYQIDPQVKLNASAGLEANDYSSAEKRTRSNFGYGADWSPNERTRLSLFKERRFFGDGRNISFTHRWPLTALRFSDTRDVSVLPDQLTTASRGTYYDLLYSQLAGSIPDPQLRAQQVTTLLQQSGIAPNAVVTTGFLTSRATVRSRQELSLVINGLRNTVTYTMFQSEQSSISTATGGIDDFSSNSTIRSSGLSSNLSHRVSASTSINLLSSQVRNSGTSGQSTKLTTMNLSVSTRIGAKTSATMGVRASRSDGSIAPFRENALLGTLVTTF